MKKETLIVDRIEDGYAVCEMENQKMIDIKLTQINGNIRDGDVLVYSDGFYKVDEELTNKRKDEVKNLVEGMWD